jgi:hypothetical protein
MSFTWCYWRAHFPFRTPHVSLVQGHHNGLLVVRIIRPVTELDRLAGQRHKAVDVRNARTLLAQLAIPPLHSGCHGSIMGRRCTPLGWETKGRLTHLSAETRGTQGVL